MKEQKYPPYTLTNIMINYITGWDKNKEDMIK